MLCPCSFLFHGNNTTGYTKSRLVDALPYVSDYMCYSTACVDTITKSRFRAAGLHIFYFVVTNAILCGWCAEHFGKERWHSLVTLCIIHSSINMLKSIWNNFTRSCNHFSPTSSMYIKLSITVFWFIIFTLWFVCPVSTENARLRDCFWK